MKRTMENWKHLFIHSTRISCLPNRFYTLYSVKAGDTTTPALLTNRLEGETDKEIQSRAEGTASGRLEGVTPSLRPERECL